MILHSDQEGNDCIWKLRCHCIQILHSDIYSVYSTWYGFTMYNLVTYLLYVFQWCFFSFAKFLDLTWYLMFPSFSDSGLCINWVKNFNRNSAIRKISPSVQGFDLKIKRTRYQSQEYFETIKSSIRLPTKLVPYALGLIFL